MKVDVAAEALREFDSSCRLVPVERRLEDVPGVRELAERADIVVNSADCRRTTSSAG